MGESKACPYCGERVLLAAVKCKHCGSNLDGPIYAIKESFGRRLLRATGGVIVVLIVMGLVYNYSRTGSLTGLGFSDRDISRIQDDIRAHFSERRGVTVEDVNLLRESPRKLSGYAKIKVPILGVMTKNCTATMGDDGRSLWQCQ